MAGSPPWIMKPGMTRWKSVPSKKAALRDSPVSGSLNGFRAVASSTKFWTVLGASAGSSFTPILPRDVSNTAY